MTELLVGTKKGLFLFEGEPGSGFAMKARAFAGQPVDFATRDLHSGRLLATVTSPFYGPKIFYTDGDPTADWEQAEGIALPDGGDRALERIWVITRGEADGTLYAGGVADSACTRSAPGRGIPTSWPSPSRPPGCGSPGTAAVPGGGATRGSIRGTCPRRR